MNEFDFDKVMDEALKVELPAGLGERLEQAIDACARRDSRSRRIRVLAPIVGIAASILICAGIFLSHRSTPPMKDTFDDPREAAIVAEQLLTLVSQELNHGIEQVAAVNIETLRQVSNTINEPFKNE